MTIQWTVIAFILYAEIGTLLILLLPWIRPIFRFVAAIKRFSRIYSYAVILVLLLLFFDAVREVRKYMEVDSNLDHRRIADADAVVHMRLFRAQRNLYISGFVLLLFLVIRRIVGLLARSALLEAAAEAAFKHADSIIPKEANTSPGEAEIEKQELLQRINDLEIERSDVINKSENLQKEYDSITSHLNCQNSALESDKKKD